MKNKKPRKNKKYKYFDKTIRKWRVRTHRFSLPGFNGVPFYHVIKFFIEGLSKGAITTRASSIAYQSFLASLPAIMLLFTLIPHIPIPNFKEGVLNVMESILPDSAYFTLKDTMEDVFLRRSGFQFFGLFIALVFSTNAINSMIAAFNETYHTEETRTWIKKRLTAILLVLIIFVLMVISMGLVIGGRYLLAHLVSMGVLKIKLTAILLWLGKWLILFALIYFAIDFLYFFAPLKSSRLKLFSAGSTFAAILTVLSTMIFDFVIDNFGRFNQLFGSIGSIIVVMMWIYFNALSLLIGYELNASIRNAHLEGWEIPQKKKNHNT